MKDRDLIFKQLVKFYKDIAFRFLDPIIVSKVTLILSDESQMGLFGLLVELHRIGLLSTGLPLFF